MASVSEATQLLGQLSNGNSQNAEVLLNLVYEEMHQLAEIKWGNWRPGQTLQHTILVHEAWQRLVGLDEKRKKIGPTTFLAGDIVDVDSFSQKLLDGTDDVSTFISARLDPRARAALASDPRREGEENRQIILVQNLNTIIGGPKIYDAEVFAAVYLRPETLELLARHQGVRGFGRLNRLLLEDAYPRELSREFHKRQFLNFAANVIQQIICEHSRRHGALKRTGETVEIDPDMIGGEPDGWTPDVVLAMRDALEELEIQHPEEAELVLLLTYAGLSIPAAADTMGFSEATAKRKWRYARIWLFNWLKHHR